MIRKASENIADYSQFIINIMKFFVNKVLDRQRIFKKRLDFFKGMWYYT